MLDPGFSLDFQTITPSVTSTHALTEFRFGRAAVRGAIEAKRQGHDAYFMNHFQDAGLAEARAAVDATIGDYRDAFVNESAKARQHEIFLREARALLAAGADVLVPTGGIPMMLFGNEPGANVDGAPIVNGVTVVVKAVEMAIKLRQLGHCGISRRPSSSFALPNAQVLDGFQNHG